MVVYKLIGHNRGRTETIGIYKDEATADKVSSTMCSVYRDGVQKDYIDVTVEHIPMYASSHDITFVMRSYKSKTTGDCLIEECVGWYHGEPDAENTNKAENIGLVAEYLF